MGKGSTEGKVIDLMAALKASLRAPTTPHDWPEDFGYENGDYDCTCITCGVTFRGHKGRVTCKVCSEPNQEGAAEC